MQFKILSSDITYTGSELSSHWIYKNHQLRGSSAVSFIGPCDVALDKMVDLEDVINEEPIYSPRMLHFIFENFDQVVNLELAVTRQLVLMATIGELLNEKLIKDGKGLRVIREGDDLYLLNSEGTRTGKLSVSIATASAVSSLIHIGLNIETEGTPVAAAGLGQMGVDPAGFQKDLMERFQGLFKGIEGARCKVRAP